MLRKPPIQEKIFETFCNLSHSVLGTFETEGLDLRFTFLNKATIQLSGIESDQLVGKLASEAGMPRVIIDLWLDHASRCRRTGKSVYFEFVRDYVERKKHVSVTLDVIGQVAGGGWCYAYVAQDMTTLRESEAALRKSEDLLNAAQSYAQMGTWEIDLGSENVFWSPSLERMLGLEPGRGPNGLEQFYALVHPDDRLALKEKVADSIVNVTDHRAEFRMKSHDGRYIWFEGRGHVLKSRGGHASTMVGVAIDISGRKEADLLYESQSAKVMHLAKMSALGEMASGIAHEINNPLTILRTNAARIKGEVQKEEPDLQKVVGIAKDFDATIKRVADIVEGLRFFARDGSADGYQDVSIAAIISDTLSFCRERFRIHGIEFQMSNIPHSLRLHCQPVQVSQVLLNLLNNAHDAVAGQATKVIGLGVEDLGDALEIRIYDSGEGIEPGIQGRIFKPFFTTKSPGKGTGLGLSIARGIVEAHHGELTLTTHKGMTCFHIRLPLKLSKEIAGSSLRLAEGAL